MLDRQSKSTKTPRYQGEPERWEQAWGVKALLFPSDTPHLTYTLFSLRLSIIGKQKPLALIQEGEKNP